MKAKRTISKIFCIILSLIIFNSANLCKIFAAVNTFDKRSGLGNEQYCWACCLSALLRNAGYDASTDLVLENVPHEDNGEGNPGIYGDWVQEAVPGTDIQIQDMDYASIAEILDHLNEQDIGWGKLLGDSVIVDWEDINGIGHHSTLLTVRRSSPGSNFRAIKLENPFRGAPNINLNQVTGGDIKIGGLKNKAHIFRIVYFLIS